MRLLRRWNFRIGLWIGYHLRPVPWRSPWWCERVRGYHHPATTDDHVSWCCRCGEFLRDR